jgi:tetratricopeptide (TPR) repeat protein
MKRAAFTLLFTTAATAQNFARCDKAYEEAQSAKAEVISDGLIVDSLENLLVDIESLHSEFKKPKHLSNDELVRCLGVKVKTFANLKKKVSTKELGTFRYNMVVGKAWLITKENSEALACFNRALETTPAPGDFDALNLSFEAWSRIQKEKFSDKNLSKVGVETFENFRQVSESYLARLLGHPRTPKTLKIQLLNDHIHFFERSGRGAETIVDNKRILEIDPGNIAALDRIAKYEIARGRQKEAKAALEKRVDLRPKSAQAYLSLIEILLDEEDYPKALFISTQAAKTFPKVADLLALHAAALVANGQNPEAIRINDAVLKNNPTNKRARGTQSFILELEGDSSRKQGLPGKALSEYAKALKLAPDALRLRIKMGLMLYDFRFDSKFQPELLSKKDMDEAVRLLAPAVAKSEVKSEYLLVFAGAASHSSSPAGGAKACDRYRSEYGPLPTAKALMDCSNIYAAAQRSELAKDLMAQSLRKAK